MNARKEKALRALITTTTLAAAARQAGISPKTLYNYLHGDEEFSARYDEERRKLLAQATEAIQKSMLPAIEALNSMVAEGADYARVGACRAVLDYALKLTETVDFVNRLEALENAQGED